jgi:hypothetical protein
LVSTKRWGWNKTLPYNVCHLADAFIQSDLQSCVHTFYVYTYNIHRNQQKALLYVSKFWRKISSAEA